LGNSTVDILFLIQGRALSLFEILILWILGIAQLMFAFSWAELGLSMRMLQSQWISPFSTVSGRLNFTTK